ncbi:MAG TPA: hypothetical protein VI685_09535 [Candidatus Angelobacter sp.]
MDSLEPTATPEKADSKPYERGSTEQAIDKYAEARIAKKKQKRKAHRARLKASNTKG